MLFSYKTRRVMARILPTVLTLVVIAVAMVICWLIWLQRFVVYTPDGVRFDFNQQLSMEAGVVPQKPADRDVVIEYPDKQTPVTKPPEAPDDPVIPDDPDDPWFPEDPDEPEIPVQTGISGYYIDAKTLQADPDAIRQQLSQLPAGTAVMFQLANFWGYRYYTSEYGTEISEENRKKMDDLLLWLADRDLYVVGRMPAFRDYYYSVDHSNYGLKKENGYLWQDPDRCYWLNPTNDKVLTRLTQIIRELKQLGFDEVVFDDFTMPETEEIVFAGDRKQAIYDAAETLVTACATDSFAVSFITSDLDFQLPEGNSRLYIDHVEASMVEEVLQQVQTPNDAVHVVFFCGTFDSRFDGCSVIRPIALAP